MVYISNVISFVSQSIEGTIKYLTGGDSDLRLKQKTIKFFDQINNPDANNDDMVTKQEFQEFLNKNLKPEKHEENGKIIQTILSSLFNDSTPSLETNKILQILKNGIDFHKPYGNDSIFMTNTKSKFLSRI